MRAGVIIAAAGLSSRMNGFKPLLQLGDRCMIDHVIDSAQISAVEQTVLVTGHRAAELEGHLKERDILPVRNESYKTSDMLESVKCGLRALDPSLDCFFVIPADMPLVRRIHYEILLGHLRQDRTAKIVRFLCDGRGGHPILIRMSCRDTILSYAGEGGLKGALLPFAAERREIPWMDQSVCRDADSREDFAGICAQFEKTSARRAPERWECTALMKANGLSWRLMGHCMQVERTALRLAEEASRKGFSLDLDLIDAAALLHDIKKGSPHHAAEGAAYLRMLGYPAVGCVIGEHMRISQEAFDVPDERAVVYLADKMTEEDRKVTIPERFGKKLSLYADDPEVCANIRTNMERALLLCEKLTRQDPS